MILKASNFCEDKSRGFTGQRPSFDQQVLVRRHLETTNIKPHACAPRALRFHSPESSKPDLWRSLAAPLFFCSCCFCLRCDGETTGMGSAKGISITGPLYASRSTLTSLRVWNERLIFISASSFTPSRDRFRSKQKLSNRKTPETAELKGETEENLPHNIIQNEQIAQSQSNATRNLMRQIIILLGGDLTGIRSKAFLQLGSSPTPHLLELQYFSCNQNIQKMFILYNH